VATLTRASILFAGRNPTSDEIAAVAAGDAATLAKAIRSYMQGPAFDRFLDEHGMTVFLTERVAPRDLARGLSAQDFPEMKAIFADGTAFDQAVRREPIELMKYIVRTERPWTEIVSADYTVVNPILAKYFKARMRENFVNPSNASEWRPAQIPAPNGAIREHAGVLSTHAWLDSFPTTPTNRNRHRVNMVARQFLATDMTALAQRPIDDSRPVTVPVVQNPACAVCHDVMDPMAAAWQNWAENNRFRPFLANGMPTALPAGYRASNYQRDEQGRSYFRPGDNWFRDGRAPGYGAEAMPGGFEGNATALQWFGQRLARDGRFAIGGVHFWYEAVFGRAPLRAPAESAGPLYENQRSAYDAQRRELDAIAARFQQGNYNVRNLLVDLVMSNWFRASAVNGLNPSRAVELHDIGSVNMLLPTQINAKLQSTTGVGFDGFKDNYTSAGLTFGDFNAVTRLNRAKDYTMLQVSVMDNVAWSKSCEIVAKDFQRERASRLLFSHVTADDTPATPQGRQAIVANIRHLHRNLLKEDFAADHPEIQRTLKLYTDIWNDRANNQGRGSTCSLNFADPQYTRRAWAGVVAYMLGDVEFIFE
jgi:hypothetical protein